MSTRDSTLHARLVDNLGATRGNAALCVLSLDNLGRIAGEYGIRASEQAIREFDDRISSLMRRSDRKLVLAPDRICVVFDELRDPNHTLLVALKIERTFEEPVRFDDIVITLTPRVGLVYCGGADGDRPPDVNRLYQSAETARELAAKEDTCFQIADPASVRQARHDWSLDEFMAKALRDHDLELFYQPQVDLRDGRILAFEGLVRWRRGDELLSPGQFIPKLSTTRLRALADYCLRGAMRDLRQLGRDISISINLDPSALRDEAFLQLLHQEAAIWEVEPARLCFEITETGVVADYARTAAVLAQFREAGYRVAIDDFGSGYSSLRHFGSLPADELKIDRSFVRRLLDDEASLHITQTIVDLAHRFDLKVTAEGIEDTATADRLRQQSCDAGQGYLFSPAVALPGAVELLAAGPCLPDADR